MSSPKEKEKRDRRADEREGQGGKRNRNESEETEEIKTPPSPSTLTCYKDSKPCPTVSQYSWTPLCRKIPDTFATPDNPQNLSESINYFRETGTEHLKIIRIEPADGTPRHGDVAVTISNQDGGQDANGVKHLQSDMDSLASSGSVEADYANIYNI